MRLLGLDLDHEPSGMVVRHEPYADGALSLAVKAPPLKPLSSSGAGWYPIIREPFTGAWQRNLEVSSATALAYFAVYTCVSLIAGDISKQCLRLVQKDDAGIWNETDNPAYSPVLRKPNRYQTIQKFVEQWIVSKLSSGNTYVLKQRDQRGVVTALYILGPQRVTPLVTQDGGVYYEIKRDDLNGLPQESVIVPASEIIHDIMCALYHPLIGVSPIYAAGMAAQQGLTIQGNSNEFFSNGSTLGGMLTAPGAISDETAARLLRTLQSKKPGDSLVGGDGLKFEKFTMSAVDAQLIEQLKWTAENVYACFHVPGALADSSHPVPYANSDPLVQQYYSQCLQNLQVNLETCLDEGLSLGPQFGNRFGTEFDINDLIWMNEGAKTTAAQVAIGAGMKVNEARKRYYALGPVKGGDAVYMQQQNFSLAALAERDADKPFSKPEPAPVPPQFAPDDEDADPSNDVPADMAASFGAALRRKALEAGLAA